MVATAVCAPGHLAPAATERSHQGLVVVVVVVTVTSVISLAFFLPRRWLAELSSKQAVGVLKQPWSTSVRWATWTPGMSRLSGSSSRPPRVRVTVNWKLLWSEYSVHRE